MELGRSIAAVVLGCAVSVTPTTASRAVTRFTWLELLGLGPVRGSRFDVRQQFDWN